MCIVTFIHWYFCLKENSDIEIISLNCGSNEASMDWNGKAFEKMKSLVTLIIKSDNFSEGSMRFPCNLRVLKWQKYHSQSIPYSFFNKVSEINSFSIMSIYKFTLRLFN
jgi:hypothetical protein